MAQHQRRACIAVGAAAAALLYFYKRRRPPDGALLIKDVLDEQECETLETLLRDLLKNGASLPGKTYSPVTHPNFVKRNQSRETLQFGAYVDKNRVQNACVAPLPPPLLRVARKLKKLGIVQQTPDACCVNFYGQGQWLPDHIDSKKFERPLVTVSLGSEQCVVFKQKGYLARCVRLPVGSALRLDGDAANDWTHGLPPATSPRISLTFRRLNAETKSKFADEARRVKERRDAKKELKRKQRNKPPKPSVRAERRPEKASLQRSDGDKTPEVEIEHVRSVYNAIAPQWHGTRYKAWPRVAKFCLMNCGPGALVADVGCGNGKMAAAACRRGACAVACDTSDALIDIAQKAHGDKKYECLVADGVRLPYRSNAFDVALNIAVLHHLSTAERRLQCIRETLRILKPGGRALFYAWAKEQKNGAENRSGHRFDAPDVLVPFHLREHGPHYDREAARACPAHAVRDERKNATVLKRYCHVFAEGELRGLVATAARVDECYYDEGNWAVACTKL